MVKVLVVLADGFEETEAVAVIDILRRGGVEVVLSSLNDSLNVTGVHDITLVADICINRINYKDFNGIFLPGGGPGVDNLSDSHKVIELVQQFSAANLWCFAICAAPYVFFKAGILKDRKFTIYPSWRIKIKSAYYLEDAVVLDDRIVTGKGMGCSFDFGLKLLELLIGKNEADKIAKGIGYTVK